MNPVTPKELDGIRTAWDDLGYILPGDVDWLLAEVERLTAEIGAHNSSAHPSLASLKAAWAELPTFLAEHSALLVEVNRLRLKIAEGILARERLMADLLRLRAEKRRTASVLQQAIYQDGSCVYCEVSGRSDDEANLPHEHDCEAARLLDLPRKAVEGVERVAE